ncbi:hypothetical protein [Citrobacter werkmanii]|uniref:hypothetical protein n=1 Tax=Citrobacter werkmanii TaxID=67827 RepID=UPI0011CEA510|nr:hypothetical protein [Citrobacter werkmanii]
MNPVFYFKDGEAYFAGNLSISQIASDSLDARICPVNGSITYPASSNERVILGRFLGDGKPTDEYNNPNLYLSLNVNGTVTTSGKNGINISASLPANADAAVTFTCFASSGQIVTEWCPTGILLYTMVVPTALTFTPD